MDDRMKTFAQSLRDMRACSPALAWVGDKGLTEAWNTCTEPSWMTWLVGRLPIDSKLLILAACDCAETAWRYCDGETLQAAMLAVHVTREYCAGRADLEDVRAARSAAAYAKEAAYANAAAYAVANAAANAAASAAAAAYAVAYSAAAAAAYANAAAYAAYAAYAVAYAANAANAGTREKAKAECCALIRERIPASLVATELAKKEEA